MASYTRMDYSWNNNKFENFEGAFHRFDEDGDGKLSPTELQRCMRIIGEELSLEDAKALVESMDVNGDGLLEFEEFIKLMEVDDEDEECRWLREAFGMYVIEGEGDCVTANSLKRMLSRLGTKRDIEECRNMICRFDLDGDGVLSFEEFKIMMI